jgi:signal transduction histidine kinase
MSNLTLYSITNRFAELMEKTENDELTEEEYNELLQDLTKELQNKSSNIIGYIQNTESIINAIKDEETRLEEMRKTAEKRLDKFKNYVKENMEKLNITKIETPLGSLNITKNPMSVEIENEELIPEEFIKIVTSKKIDKTAIKNHFKETGEIVEGTSIINNKTSLRVK